MRFSEIPLKDGESIEEVSEKLRVIQGQDVFRFGTDAVKLSNFTNIKPGDRVMDLCTGTGIIPLLLWEKEPNISACGLEIQPDICEMAQRTVKLNNLTDKIDIILGDVKEVRQHFEPESFQVVTCNPPYMKNSTGKQNQADSISIARHEILCRLSDCMEAAAYLLPSGGRFYMVHRPERLADVIASMRQVKIEPKRLTLLAGNAKRPPRLMVIEGQKNRNSGMIVTFETGDVL